MKWWKRIELTYQTYNTFGVLIILMNRYTLGPICFTRLFLNSQVRSGQKSVWWSIWTCKSFWWGSQLQQMTRNLARKVKKSEIAFSSHLSPLRPPTKNFYMFNLILKLNTIIKLISDLIGPVNLKKASWSKLTPVCLACVFIWPVESFDFHIRVYAIPAQTLMP